MKALKKWLFLALCMIGATDVFAKTSLSAAQKLNPQPERQLKVEQIARKSSCCSSTLEECGEVLCFVVAPYLCVPGLDCCCCKGNYYQGTLLCTAAVCAFTTSEWLQKRRLSKFKQNVSIKRD